jgi:2',3'-cyclic-nucleotide 2'-phosphodiesterase (5'-nucleotidase family)
MKSSPIRRSLIPALLLVFAIACRHGADVTSISVETVELNKQSATDSLTAVILHPFKDSLDKIMNEVVSVSDTAMPKERDKTETLLGNFVADICLIKARERASATSYTSADICLLNTGGLRSSIPKGIITRGNIYELMPFDNELVVVTISGVETWNLFRYVAASGGQPMAGINFEIKNDKTPGKIFIGGIAIDTSRTYNIVTSDYLAAGGDKMDFLRKPIHTYNTGIKIRDALMEYCIEQHKKGLKIGGRLDGRIHYETR